MFAIILYFIIGTSTFAIGEPTREIVLSTGSYLFLEKNFENLDGVFKVETGYAGGKEINPTFEQVANGYTSHRFSVRVWYNPDIISDEQILTVFFRGIDPTDRDGSFGAKGRQYTPAIHTFTDNQNKVAHKFVNKMSISSYFKNKEIILDIVPYTTFFKAEEKYQDFAKKNPFTSSLDSQRKGRSAYIKTVWDTIPQGFFLDDLYMLSVFDYTDTEFNNKYKNYKKPSQQELRSILTDTQYAVTQKRATEIPFENEFYKHVMRGLYVDIVSGEPLFSSIDKIDLNNGWPTFKQPLSKHFVVEKDDFSFFMHRKEVRSRYADSYLGYVFNDGPHGALRYVVNSTALRFITFEDMEKEGYGEFLALV